VREGASFGNGPDSWEVKFSKHTTKQKTKQNTDKHEIKQINN
jgi:hypothetical protein